MADTEHETGDDKAFLDAAKRSDRGLIAEFVGFMAENKAWWMTPILLVLAVVGGLLILGATGVAPFVYTFF